MLIFLYLLKRIDLNNIVKHDHAIASTLGFGGDIEAFRAFKAYEEQYGKNYSFEEREIRAQIFHENYSRIQHHNAKDLSWTMGINEVSLL